MNYDDVLVHAQHLLDGGSWVRPLTALVGAFVFGQVLAWTYERTYHGLSYSRGFSHTLVLVCISASILVLSMQYSLIAGLGLFGILSMIRFRTDLKTSRDLVFVMGSACLGVACGVGAMLEAALGTATFSLVAIYLYAGPFGSRTRFDGVLRFRIPIEDTDEATLARLFKEHCLRRHLLSTADAGDGASVERAYQIKFFDESDREALLASLRRELGARDARLLLQDATSEY